jgi:hypothetical protein
MMDIPAIDDPRVMVVIELPTFEVTLRLPRFDFLPEPILDKMDAQLTAIGENTELNDRKKLRQARLCMFKAVVSAKDYKVLETMTKGQLELVYSEWADQSNIELGKYLASAPFSTENTEAPSSMISSPTAATTATTSDAA